jgi:hypothetical protein
MQSIGTFMLLHFVVDSTKTYASGHHFFGGAVERAQELRKHDGLARVIFLDHLLDFFEETRYFGANSANGLLEATRE